MLTTLVNSFLPRHRAGTVETLGHPAAGVVGWLDPGQTTGGVTVTDQTALTLSAVFCAVRIISETLATLPCVLYRKTTDDSRERADTDSRYWLMRSEPHPLIDPVTFFETQTAQLVLNGNCYSEIIPTQGLDVAQLEPKLSTRVTPKVMGDTIAYEVTEPKETIRFDDMLHVKGLGSDAVSGWSVVKVAAASLGQAIAAESRATKQHENNAMPGGAIVHPMRLDKPAREELRRSWDEVHAGAKNAGKVAILHGGMDFKPFTLSNEDMQFLESRQFSLREIARWFRLPPHMLADLQDSSVRANIEQQAIEFIVYSMGIWLVRWQQALNRKLLNRDERRSMYFEFMLDALLRGDQKSRYEAYAVGRQWGWFSVNDIRRMENMNAVDGGDIYLQPVNMVEAGTVPETVTNELQGNLAQSLVKILEQGQHLKNELQAGVSSVEYALATAAQQANESIKGIREDRELIRRDIAELGRTQATGMAARNQLSRATKIERGEIAKAARKQVNRGDSFIAWLDEWYAQSDLPEDWKAESRRLLLDACDGDRDAFIERIQAVLKTWDERIANYGT